MSRCVNTDPGFQCLECPEGYNGTYEDALAYNISHRVFLYTNQERSNYTYQTCEDIDECASNHGGCDALMTCVNTQVCFVAYFYAPVSKDWGHIVLLLSICMFVRPSICPSVCLHKLNLKT